MDRDAFLAALGKRISEVNAPQEQKRLHALARSNRVKEIEAIIQPYAEALIAGNVKNALGTQGNPPVSLIWNLSYSDNTLMSLTVADNSEREQLELAFAHTAYNGVYIDLSFLHKAAVKKDVEPEVTQMHLDDQWSPETFEKLVQDTITAFFDEAMLHGGTALITR